MTCITKNIPSYAQSTIELLCTGKIHFKLVAYSPIKSISWGSSISSRQAMCIMNEQNDIGHNPVAVLVSTDGWGLVLLS
jgi:hypothetical protein